VNKECPDERKNIRSLQYLEAEVLDELLDIA